MKTKNGTKQQARNTSSIICCWLELCVYRADMIRVSIYSLRQKETLKRSRCSGSAHMFHIVEVHNSPKGYTKNHHETKHKCKNRVSPVTPVNVSGGRTEVSRGKEDVCLCLKTQLTSTYVLRLKSNSSIFLCVLDKKIPLLTSTNHLEVDVFILNIFV